VARQIRIMALLFISVLAGDAWAIACEAVFSNAVGTTGKKLEISDNASLTNTGGGVLATDDLKTKNQSTPCDGQACTATGSAAPTLVIPPHNTKIDSKNNSLTLAPGDYYFDKLEFGGGNTVTLTGSGQVRIHVAGDLHIGGNAQINVNGDPLDLVFLVSGNVDILDNAQVHAVIYAEKKIEIKDHALVVGAVVGDQAKIRDNATVSYTSTTGLTIGGVCGAASQLHHLRLLHDGFGIVGVSETITVQACADADCNQLFGGSVDLILVPSGAATTWSDGSVSGSQLTVSGGQQAVYLVHNNPGTINIGATASPAAANPTRCFVGASESCAMHFVQPTLLVNLPDQVAGGNASGSVSLSDCWPDFQTASMPIELAAQYVSPLWVGPPVMVNGTALPTDSSSVTLNLSFDAACSAPLQVSYPDAGQLAIAAAFTGSGALSGLNMVGSGNLVFYPATLQLQATDASGGALNATAPGAMPVQGAGEAFTLTVTALNVHGAPTQGYRPQASDRIRFYVQRTGPLSGFDGALAVSSGTVLTSQVGPPAGPADYAVGNVAPGDFFNGVYTYTQAAYSEVGLLTLHLLDTDYMGHGIAATPLAVGRFVPAGFAAAGSVVNRVATPGCAGGSFSYLGEPLRLTAQLTALNAQGAVTRNYQGSYASFTGSGLTAFSGGAGTTVAALASGTDLSGRLAVDAVGLSMPWSAGMAVLDADLRLLAAATPDGPYDATQLGLAFSDADGVALQGLDIDVDGNGPPDHRALGSTDFRYGRVAVANAHGSELLNLDVPVAIQFYAGAAQGFKTHTLDNCSPIGGVLLGDADPADGLSPTDSCIVDPLGISGPQACPAGTPGTPYRDTALSGVYALSLLAPGAGKTGALRVHVDAPAWAEFDWAGTGASDPQGLATFGIYHRETGIIYQREVR